MWDSILRTIVVSTGESVVHEYVLKNRLQKRSKVAQKFAGRTIAACVGVFALQYAKSAIDQPSLSRNAVMVALMIVAMMVVVA